MNAYRLFALAHGRVHSDHEEFHQRLSSFKANAQRVQASSVL